MSNAILYKIASALGTTAGYLSCLEMRDLFLFITKIFVICSLLSAVYVLYAVFYLNEPLQAIFQPLLNQIN